MKVDIEIGGGAKALDEGDGASLSLGMGQAGFVDREGRQGAVNDLQHRYLEIFISLPKFPKWFLGWCAYECG